MGAQLAWSPTLSTGKTGMPGKAQVAACSMSDVLESVLSDCLRWAVYGGALTAAGGLVFYGTMEGWLKAVDQKTGQELWRFKTRRASSATP